jgi:hypothetical protein
MSSLSAFFGSDPNPTPLSLARVITELPAPVVTFDGKTHTITIFRKSGAWLKESFKEYTLSVHECPKDDVVSNLIYYLKATPLSGDRPLFISLESKEEADAVAKAIQEAEEFQWREEMVEADKEPCTFCGEILRDCGGDHVDEMRDIQRKALRSD